MAGNGSPQPIKDLQALIDSAFFGPSKQYVRWDTGLHEVFEAAVQELGGPHAAKPAVIRERMGISLLTTAQVKSHLQKYRIRVVAEKGTENATEAQARAAQQLLERQKRQGQEGVSLAPRPRSKVPIRGSRQASGTSGAAGSAGTKRASGGARAGRKSGGGRKRRRSDSASWSDDEDDEEFDAEISLSEGEDGEPSLGSSQGGSQGEGRSASTTATRRAASRQAAPAAAAASQQGPQQHHKKQRQHKSGSGVAPPALHVKVEEVEPTPLAELSKKLSLEGMPLDPIVMAGLASRQLAVAAAAAAAGSVAGARQPSGGGSGEQGSTAVLPLRPASAAAAAAQLPPALPGVQAAHGGGLPLGSASAVASLNRQVQLEQALLEQSMWVQKLAAEVQDLRHRQRVGLPPPAGEVPTFATPFAAMAGAAFPGAAPDPAEASKAAPAGNLATCDSTLLRLLSNTLGQASSWKPEEATDALAALLRETDAVAVATAANTAVKPPLAPAAPAPSGAMAAAAAAAAAAASNPLLTCDSTFLRMLSQSLYDSMPPPVGAALPGGSQQAADVLGALALGPDVQAAIAAAAAAAAAAVGPAATVAALGPTAGSGGQAAGGGGAAAAPTGPTPFAAAAAQALMPPPSLQMMSALGAMASRPLAPGHQTSLDAFNSSLLSLGLAGAASAAFGNPAEFMRLCSLPNAADLLPQPFELGGN